MTDRSVFPFVSVLIPIRNEGNYISQCLQAVTRQDYPSDLFEILISDGLSTDNTRSLVADWMKNDSRIRLFDNPKQIVPTGMNILIPKAKGEILIRVDGHCVIAKNYISNCVRHLEEEDVDGVGGPMRSIGEDLISQVTALAMSSKFGVGNSSFRTETGQTKLADTVPFPAYTRAIIEKVGLYDEELVRNQDDEYNYRIREAGGKILLAEDVSSEYYSRGSLKKLWKQYFQYGFWKVRVLQKHPRQMSLRQFIPLGFVLALILTLFLSFLVPWGWKALLALLAAYLLANLSASIMTASGQGFKKLLLLPLAFAIIHLSYGLGFLVGLFKFWNRWGDKAGKVPKFEV
ncbi:MAG TPA: glycosyltransferase family 2 protein [Anaerolineaceae bacterium]|nr:glycosyltransferase family 2 protein [Anaerolineaceae bacterium]